jgi:hypothetical protein
MSNPQGNGQILFSREPMGPQISAHNTQQGYTTQNLLTKIGKGGRGRGKRGGAFAANIISNPTTNSNNIASQLALVKALEQNNIQSSQDNVPTVKGGRRNKKTRKTKTRKTKTRKTKTRKTRRSKSRK